VPIGRNMGAAMAEVPKVPVVPFVQVVVVKTVDSPRSFTFRSTLELLKG
jgi:hypothetical protein